MTESPDFALAIVGLDRQLHVLDGQGGGLRQVTWSRVVGGLAGWGGVPTPDGRSWPCWSPDGRWLACFRQEGSGEGARAEVGVVQVDGVEERLLLRFDDEIPIYAQWSHDGGSLAVLSQRQEELQLRVVELHSGRSRVVEQGVPLFFAWAPGRRALVVHAGSGAGRGGRVMLRNVGADGEDVVLPAAPGTFCTPLVIPGDPPRIAFAAAAGAQRSHVITARLDGSDARHVSTLRGLLAIVPDLEGRRLAIGCAPGGESTPYDGIFLAGLEGGAIHQLSRLPCMSFLWCRGGRRLVVAALDRDAGCARWRRIDIDDQDPTESDEQELGPFWPTRDQLFHLHFFEQFVPSHALVDPTGRWLVYATFPDPADRSIDPRPRIECVDLDASDPEPRLLAHGRFACFAPVRTG